MTTRYECANRDERWEQEHGHRIEPLRVGYDDGKVECGEVGRCGPDGRLSHVVRTSLDPQVQLRRNRWAEELAKFSRLGKTRWIVSFEWI